MWVHEGARGRSEREDDLTAVLLQDTVRIPREQWPDSLVVALAGLRAEHLASSEFLAKVRPFVPPFRATVLSPVTIL